MRKEPPPKRLKVTSNPVSSAPVSILPSNATTSVDNLHEPFDISKGFTKVDSIQPVESQAMVGLGSSGLSANKGVLIYKQNANDTPVNTVAKEGKTGSKVTMTELRNFLITLLEENPNGMTIKAVDKAVAESMVVNVDRKLTEKMLRSISSYHAPGKYILNSGIEKGSFVGAPVPIVGRPLASTSSAKETEEEHSSDMFKEVNVMERKYPEELGNKISSHQSDSFCEKKVSPLVIDSEMHDLTENRGDLPIISDTKVRTPEASNSSSSSEDGSESESESESESDSASESGSSGSGTASSESESGSGSASASGSDSDGNTSSSETSMDEDVDIDIMSDDEKENSFELKHKVKVKNMESELEDDDKLQEHVLEIEPSCELHEKNPLKASSTIQKIDMGAKDNAGLESDDDDLFCSDHNDNDSKVLSKTDELANKDKRISSPQTLDRNSENRKRNDLDQNVMFSGLDGEDAENLKRLDILIENICEYKDVQNHKVNLHKQKDPKSRFSSTNIKSNIRVHEVTKLEKKDQSGDNSSEISFQSTLEARKGGVKDRILRKEKPSNREESNLKQVSTKLTRVNITNSRGKQTKEPVKNTDKVSESRGRDKSPESMVQKASPPFDDLSERGISRMHGGVKGVKIPDHGVKDIKIESCQKDGHVVKERVNESKLRKARASKAMQAQQQWSQKDVETETTCSSKDSDRLIAKNQDALLQGDDLTKENIRKGSGHELFERVRLMEKQAERPLMDADFSSKDKYSLEKDLLQEESSRKRPSYRAYSKDGQCLESTDSDSGWCSSRKRNANVRKSLDNRLPSQDLELGEFREPLSENEYHEQTRESIRTEIVENIKDSFEAQMNLKSRKLQPMHLDFSDSPKQSSVSIKLLEDDIQHDVRCRLETVEPLKLPQTRPLKDQSRKPSYQIRNASVKEWKVFKARSDIMSSHIHANVKKKHIPQPSEVQGCDFFAPYEKKEPEFRGPICNSEQFKNYLEEFNEKYEIYARLHTSIELNKEEFTVYWKNIEMAKCRGDRDKLENIYMEVKTEYHHCHKRCKRMRRTFKVLHEELQVIKRHCREYIQEFGRR